MKLTVFVLYILLRVTNSCTEIAQVCYKCRGDISVCTDGTGFMSTPEQCVSHVMSSSTSVAAHYYPDIVACLGYTCDNNLYFSDSNRFAVRETCNTDCPTFTLTEHEDSSIQTPAFSSGTKSRGQCFADCFETLGCYAFSYDGSVCKIYTSCGTSCTITSSSGTTVYTRDCGGDMEASDCGSLTDPPNGAVDTLSGTFINGQATYTCSSGHTLVGSSTRTCQADGQWSGSEPVCNPATCEALTSPTNGVVSLSSGSTYLSQAKKAVLPLGAVVGPEAKMYFLDRIAQVKIMQLGVIALYTLFSVTNSCTKIVQVCHKCIGHSSVCSNGFGFVALKESCASHVLSSTTSVAAQYSPFWCKPFACTNNLYFSDSYIFAIRETCNTDCPTFTLTEHVDSSVQTPAFSSGTKSRGQCFADCFDTPGCYTFSFDGSECNIYTSCGTSCNMKSSSGTTVYTRVCDEDNSAADCGPLTYPTNGEVDTSSGTLTNAQAIYTCSLGYTLVGSNTRTCQSDGQWDGSEPVCNPVDCGTPTAPVNGAVVVASGTTYGQDAVFSCDVNYTLSGVAVSTCNANGVWDATPWCFLSGNPISQPIKLYILPCICYSNKTFTNMTQEEIIHYLIKETKIERNATSLSRRKLTSADDPRLSSKLVGYSGIIVISVGLGAVLLTDILMVCQWYDKKKND